MQILIANANQLAQSVGQDSFVVHVQMLIDVKGEFCYFKKYESIESGNE